MLFGVIIKMILGVTNAIYLDEGFCLWIPACAGMTYRLYFVFQGLLALLYILGKGVKIWLKH
jgi:hypothetical protein